MDLQNHLRARQRVVAGGGLDEPVQVDHGQLDQVGSRALDHGVDGGALGQGAALGVGRLDLGDGAAAPEHGGDEAVVHGLLDALGQEGGDAGEAGLVAVDDLGGLGVGHAQASGQAEGGHAVDDAEVDHLGARALLTGDLIERHVVDLGGHGGVDVLAGVEGGDEGGVL